MSEPHSPLLIGQAGGQTFDVGRAIRNFLQQMAEGNIDLGAAVIKELVQNADDAGASEMGVILDERTPPSRFEDRFAPLQVPSILVRNDRPFEPENFEALCEVGSGQKLSNPTAAGRFGIGFNSVYFLTDTPLIFSQREVHLFDLLHHVVDKNGWKFSLDVFRQGENVGPIKTVLERAFPKLAMDTGMSFADIAHNGGYYGKTLITLPLRQWEEGDGRTLFQNNYKDPDTRQRLLASMWEESIRSLLFLKHVEKLTFSVLRDSGLEEWGCASISKHPSAFTSFLEEVSGMDKSSIMRDCACDFFERKVTFSRAGAAVENRSFFIKHFAPFGNREISDCRQRLQKNQERATPWAAVAIPKDLPSLLFASESPLWRVFLPVNEPGPCSCILHAALFVGPSRQRIEYRTDESDEAQRKTQWNQLLVTHALVPLLRDADLNKLIPDVLEKYPKEALGLIPEVQSGATDKTLGEYFRRVFHEGPWELRLRDIWRKTFTLLVNDTESPTVIEMIPEWAMEYREKFAHASSVNRVFVTWRLGDALRDRLTEAGGVRVQRGPQEDIARSILTGKPEPKPEHLVKLLNCLIDSSSEEKDLERLWAFQQMDDSLVQYSKNELYLVPGPDRDAVIHDCLRKLKLDFENVRWVKNDIGLPALKQAKVENLKNADAASALELFRRVGSANRHDQFTTHHDLTPVVDFLCLQQSSWLQKDLRLAFLVKTASNQEQLRENGAIFLRSERPREEEHVLWEGLLRGTFAEVDPAFAPHLRRLLGHAPSLQQSLDVPGCRFNLVGSTSVLEFLHRSRIQNPACVSRLAKELKNRSQLRLDAKSRVFAYRAARLLIEEADRSWDSKNDEEKRTVLLLPVHRTAEGELIELATVDSDIESLSNHFWLQSDEDLHGVPIKLLDRQILHSGDPTVNRFYRRCLGIRMKDRITLLRQCLTQIGSDDLDNLAILKYISDYFGPTIEKLLKTGSNEALAEIQDLKNLLGDSKSVPCADNVWRKASDCKSGSSLAKELCIQGWSVARANELAQKVTHPTHLASLDLEHERLVDHLHRLDAIPSNDLAQLAATSESSSLGLKERAKIIHDNLRPTESKLPPRAKVIQNLRCPSFGGETEFQSLGVLPAELPPFNSSLVQCPLPAVADLEKLGKDWGMDRKSARSVLIYLGVPVLPMTEVVQAVVKATTGVHTGSRSNAWEDLAQWLANVADAKGSSLTEALKDQPWVLAKKGQSIEFHLSSDVLYRTSAGEILDKEFWTIAGSLPSTLANFRQELGFLELLANSDTVTKIARCLAQSSTASIRASTDVYRLTSRLIRGHDPTVRQAWQKEAGSSPVFRLFRSPEVWSKGDGLYLGNDDLRVDYGDQLRCVSTNSALDPEILTLYRDLGISAVPTLPQVLAALGNISRGGDPNSLTYSGLIDLLADRLRSNTGIRLSLDQARQIRVLTRAGTYACLSSSYQYPAVTKAEELDLGSRGVIIDEQDPPTKKLLNLLQEKVPGAVVDLTTVALAQLQNCDEVRPSVRATQILAPWEEWLADFADCDSELRARLGEYLAAGPLPNFRLHVKPRLSITYTLRDGRRVRPSAAWIGPAAFVDRQGGIFIRGDVLEQDFVASPQKLDVLDAEIAEQVSRLLSQEHTHEVSQVVLSTLGRPRVVLGRLRDRAQEFLLHQYNDQNADAEFTRLLDEYSRTSEGTAKSAKLEQQLFQKVHESFVPARREQIRAYGYDRFSVFAELLQNAEDAYLQGKVLGLNQPDPAYIRFSFLKLPSGESLLRLEHEGRPFNRYRHGNRKEETYRKDVEGVLRSAGSFKPQAQLQHSDLKTIGRFGLGFKSVLLLTDRPSIHSDQWHFEIEAGCLPKQIQRPDDLATEVTRIDLPLLSGVNSLETNLDERLASLMPFLQQISQIELVTFDGTTHHLRTSSVPLIDGGDAGQIERCKINRPGGNQFEFLRLRHTAHPGQLAMHLDPEGLPAKWNQAFEWDTFAALPLRLHLGVGVGVSHHFDIQAGRTHLIALDENQGCFEQLADLMNGLPAAMESCVAEKRDRDRVMQRFWTLWSWDTGDKDGEGLRFIMAKKLMALAESNEIIPTRDRNRCVALRDGSLFCFHGIPEDFAEELVKHEVEVFPRVPLTSRSVIRHSTHSALLQTARAAKTQVPESLRSIGWAELEAVFRARPWFADKPDLFCKMAGSLSSDERNRVLAWLGKCKFLASDRTLCIPAELLPQTFPGHHYLPQGRLKQIDLQYDEVAVELLKSVGMQSQPTADTLLGLLDGLNGEECLNLLRYLAEDNRWKLYYELQTPLRKPWLANGDTRLSSADALAVGLIPFELDEVFQAWLGVSAAVPEPVSPPRPSLDTRKALRDISEWWRTHKESAVKVYERRTYPGAQPPRALAEMENLQRELKARRDWLTLFILGCLHTLGRTKPEQHKGFLSRCHERGWFDVFADPDSSAERWIRILEDYCAEIESESYRQWMLQFVSIFTLARHLPDYAYAFLDIERHSSVQSLDLITRPRTNPINQGGGPDAPPAQRMLGIGACFVMRELVRLDVLKTKHAHPHCFVPHERVRRILSHLGWQNSEGANASQEIYKFLVRYLNEEEATFERCFDLPFQAISEDSELQKGLLGGVILE